MGNDFEEFAEKAKRVAGDSVNDLKERLSSVKDIDLEGLNKAASELAEEAASFVRKYPLQSVLGAAVAGFALGILTRRRK